jgi:hypothetical protein
MLQAVPAVVRGLLMVVAVSVAIAMTGKVAFSRRNLVLPT